MTEPLEPGPLLRAANDQVTRLTRAARWTRIQVWALTAISVVLVVGYVAGGFIVHGEYSLTRQVKNSAAAGCRQGNAQRAADLDNWKFFLSLLLRGDAKPADRAEARLLLQHVARADAPRDCQKVYGGH